MSYDNDEEMWARVLGIIASAADPVEAARTFVRQEAEAGHGVPDRVLVLMMLVGAAGTGDTDTNREQRRKLARVIGVLGGL